ncbi:MAG: hypothetical protein C4547_13545 [Phycisphaerales bacterium]|nr:MAG: hypothetical protein C4547_13545 [Phycisphaerales bacterium]
MRVLVVNSDGTSLQPLTRRLQEGGWQVIEAQDWSMARQAVQVGDTDAVIVRGRPADAQYEAFQALAQAINRRGLPAVVTDERFSIGPDARTLVDVTGTGATESDLVNRLSTVMRYHVWVRRMESELENMQRLGKRLNDHFNELDQEMRLAGRLQRDFLPRGAEPIPGVKFTTIFRPAMWVSGDIYDYFRIDEHHVGFFIADAVGHGVAASLLTMFIKQAVSPKRVTGQSYEVLDPSEVLRALNVGLADQMLPNCQFVTACYCLLDTRTLTLRFARGGHPYPVLIRAGGAVRELQALGGLMGLFAGETFPSDAVQLAPGDKVVLYTDGIELAFPTEPGAAGPNACHLDLFARMGRLPLPEMVERLEDEIDDQTGSLEPRDDITVVCLEIAGAAAARNGGL